MQTYVLKNNEKVIIREAVIEDAEAMIDYLNKIGGESDFLTFGSGEISISVEKERSIIEDSIISDNKLFIVAEINGKIIGNLNFSGGSRPRIKHVGEFGISVLKEYWGFGIGKEIIKYLLNWAKESEIIKKINLKVREDNERGIKLYKSLGFKEEGMVSREFIINGQYYSAIIMGKEID